MIRQELQAAQTYLRQAEQEVMNVAASMTANVTASNKSLAFTVNSRQMVRAIQLAQKAEEHLNKAIEEMGGRVEEKNVDY